MGWVILLLDTVQVNSEDIQRKKLAFIKSKLQNSRDGENSLIENVQIDEPYGEQSNRLDEDKVGVSEELLRRTLDELAEHPVDKVASDAEGAEAEQDDEDGGSDSELDQDFEAVPV